MIRGVRRLARPSTRFWSTFGALALLLAAPGVEGIAQIQCSNKFSSSAANSIGAGGKAEYSFCPVLNMECTSPKVTCASIDGNGDGYLSKEETLCSFASLWDGPELLGLGTDVAQARSPFADAGTISVEGQSFSLAFALSGPEGSDWRSAIDCDALSNKNPFCFAAFTARLDTNKDGKWSVEECEAGSDASTAIRASAASGRRGGADHDSKEGAQDGRRQMIGAALAQKLVESGVSQVGDPNAGEYFPKERQPWFMKPGASEEPFEITGWIYTGICVIWFLCLCYLRYKKGTFDDRQIHEMTVALQAIALALWFFYDFSFMCARFNWLLTDERADYEVWSTSYEQEDESIYWLSDKWFQASDKTLLEHECPNKVQLFLQDAQPAPDDACNFGPSLWFSADILRKNDNVEMTAQKISIGLGLLIWPILYVVVASTKILQKIWGYPNFTEWPPWDKYAFEEQQRKNELEKISRDRDQTWREHFNAILHDEQERNEILETVAQWALFTIFTVLLGVQQSVVVLPIANARINPYCLVLNVPSSQRYGACIHKWSATGLPYGTVLLVGGFFFGIVGFALLKKSKMVKDFLPESDDGSATGGNFGTSHEAVPVDEEGGNMCYVEEGGEPYVLSSQAVFVQGSDFGQKSMQTSAYQTSMQTSAYQPRASMQRPGSSEADSDEARDYFPGPQQSGQGDTTNNYTSAGEFDDGQMKDSDVCNCFCGASCAIGGLMAFVLGVILIAIWLFGGMIIGLWFAYAEVFEPLSNFAGLPDLPASFSMPRFQDLSIIKNVIVPSVVIGPSIVSFFLMMAEKALGLRKGLPADQLQEFRQKVQDAAAKRKEHHHQHSASMQLKKMTNFIAGQAHHDNDMAVISGNAAEQAGKYGGYSMSIAAAAGAKTMLMKKGTKYASQKAVEEASDSTGKGILTWLFGKKEKKQQSQSQARELHTARDLHPRMDTYRAADPSLQIAPRDISTAPIPPIPPIPPFYLPSMAGSPPMFGSPVLFTDTSATPAMSTGNAAPVPPTPPIPPTPPVPPSAALGFPVVGMPIIGGPPPAPAPLPF